MVIDGQRTEDEDEDRRQLQTGQTLVVDERIVADVEAAGFPKQFIVSSLNNDELNYVTTFYYLLAMQKEY